MNLQIVAEKKDSKTGQAVAKRLKPSQGTNTYPAKIHYAEKKGKGLGWEDIEIPYDIGPEDLHSDDFEEFTGTPPNESESDPSEFSGSEFIGESSFAEESDSSEISGEN
ncbi:MAG: hypothetical protein A2Y14_05125 [Verrucomicrobia bacterium GWF2_51_19]|nr:MAG: hypothetical protein A2Y14_05125 [Verrucomicrobia bacterium GWF2_51_19]HCJ12486.1 hypothetical protein [Opitutae bacterium]